MTQSAIVNDNTQYSVPKNAMLSSKRNMVAGIAVIVTTLVEAVLAFIFFFNPYYIKTVYRSASQLTQAGNPAKVVLFKDIFMTDAEASAATHIEIAIWGKLVQIGIIYLIFAILPIVMAFLHIKKQSFTNSYFVINYFAKIVFAVVPFIVPFANLVDPLFKKRFLYLRVSCAVMLAIAAIGLVYFFTRKVKITYSEKTMTSEDSSSLRARTISGIIFIIPIISFLVIHKITRYFVTKETSSFFMDWENTNVTQGLVFVAIFAVLVACVLAFISEKDFGIIGLATFSLGFFVADVLAALSRIKARGFGPNAIILLVQAGITLFIAVFAILIIQKIKPKPYEKTRDNSIANLSINIASGLYILAVVAPIVASYFLDKKAVWVGFDYTYIGLILSIALLAALSLINGYDWAYLYMTFSSVAFIIMQVSPILSTIQLRKDKMAVAVIEGTKYKGIAELTSLGFIGLSVLLNIAVILLLVINSKKIKDYLYQKRY